MNVSPEEARQSLTSIHQVSARTSNAALAQSAPFPLIWGLVWILGCVVTQFLSSSPLIGWLWGGLVLLGSVASAVVGIRLGTQVRTTSGVRVASFFWALAGYTGLGLWIVQPRSGVEVAVLIILAVMFGYVVMGLWLNVMPLIGFGLAEMALSVLGYYLFPAYFPLWIAFVGGGAFIATGLYMLSRGKQA